MLKLLSCTLVSVLLLAQSPQQGSQKANSKNGTTRVTQQTSGKAERETKTPSQGTQSRTKAKEGAKATAETQEKAVPLHSVAKAPQQRIAAFWIILPGGKR